MNDRDEAPVAAGASDSIQLPSDNEATGEHGSTGGQRAACGESLRRSPRRRKRKEYADHHARGGTRLPRRVETCHKLHRVGIRGGAFSIGGAPPCNSFWCLDCASRELDRLADHYGPLLCQSGTVFMSIQDMSWVDDEAIRERVGQRARRLTEKGEDVAWLRVAAYDYIRDDVMVVFSTHPLPGRKEPTKWMPVSGQTAAIVLDGLLVPYRVVKRPSGSETWHLPWPERHRSNEPTFGHFKIEKAEAGFKLLSDRFEEITGYRPALDQPVCPEHQELLNRLGEEVYTDRDDVGLGDDGDG